MTPQTKDYPVVQSVIGRLARWLKNRREIVQWYRRSDGDAYEYERMARDLGLSLGELEALVRRGPHAADELPKLMAALHLDAEAIGKLHPLAQRDMERVCALCDEKRRCDHDLAAGTAAQRYSEYCRNAAVLEAMGEEKS